MEVLRVICLSVTLVCGIAMVNSLPEERPNVRSQSARVDRLPEERPNVRSQSVRNAAFLKSQPKVLTSAVMKSREKTVGQDEAFFKAGVDKIANFSSLGTKAILSGTKAKSVQLGQSTRAKIALINEIAQVLDGTRDELADTVDILLQDGGGPASSFVDLVRTDGVCKRRTTPRCDSNSRYRTADGSCNNLGRPDWGQAFIPMRRFLKPAYQDGMFTPRTLSVVTSANLPSARNVSRTVHETNEKTSNSVTHMAMQWGQFLDHDITSTPLQQSVYGSIPTCCIDDVSISLRSRRLFNPGSRDICFPIEIPHGDSHFKQRSCLSFVRSVQVENVDCRTFPVEQLNQITAFIDGSQIYGSSLRDQRPLRTLKGGLLKTSPNNLLPKDDRPSCVLRKTGDYCFKAGDARVNEQMALASMHTIWMRQHNRVSRELALFNPDLDDETLFQESRKLVGALLQHITYSEFLPIVLGPAAMKSHQLLLAKDFSHDYKSNTDPSIRNAFATAAYRFGHSMIQTRMSQYDRNYIYLNAYLLKESFSNPSQILKNNGDGVNTYIRGLLVDNIRMVDRFMTQQVTNHLFEDPSGNSLDLAALNIQRGRDHGLPGYNQFRKWCHLSAATSFHSLPDHPTDAKNKLQSVYRHVDDIDLFSGGVSENPVKGGLVGPTFACILANQFKALKQGDRFWFERDIGGLGFRLDQIRQIKKVQLSRVICDNTDTKSIQRLAFQNVAQHNPRMKCSDPRLAKLDLRKWLVKDRLGPWTGWSACRSGRQYRTRRCLSGPSCRGETRQTRMCESWGPWKWWECRFRARPRFKRRLALRPDCS